MMVMIRKRKMMNRRKRKRRRDVWEVGREVRRRRIEKEENWEGGRGLRIRKRSEKEKNCEGGRGVRERGGGVRKRKRMSEEEDEEERPPLWHCFTGTHRVSRAGGSWGGWTTGKGVSASWEDGLLCRPLGVPWRIMKTFNEGFENTSKTLFG